MVHKKLLIRDSQFFKRAFTSGFKEGQTNEIRLPEEDEDTVDAYIQWLYGRGSAFDGDDLALSLTVCLKLYAFAERILHMNLADHIMDYFKSSWQVPDWPTIVTYWTNTPTDPSPMKACLVHKTADRLAFDNDHALKPLIEPLSGEYFGRMDTPSTLLAWLHRVLQTLLPHERTPFPPRSGPLEWCAWHLHGPNDACEKRGLQVERFYDTKAMRPITESLAGHYQGETSSSSGNGNGNGGNGSSGNEGAHH